MSYLVEHWSFDPFMIIAVVAVIWHETGLARLARRSRPDRTRQRRLRSIWFYCGLAVLLIAVQSPVDYWADDYFFVHMIQHLLLMFAAPTLIVAGAPWQPLLAGLPGHSGKTATREVMTAAWSRPLRAVGGFMLRPWISIIFFNLVMIFWHLPGPFDLAERNPAAHIWLMHSTFFLAGVLFWLQFIESAPFRIKMSTVAQATALVATNCVMWILAMAMGFLSSTSWYSVYNHIPGRHPASAVRRSADWRRDPVDLRRLLGHTHHDFRDPQAHGRGRQRQRGRRSDAGPRLCPIQLGEPRLTRERVPLGWRAGR